VSALTAGFSQVTSFLTEMQKRSQELATAEAEAAAGASAGATPSAVRPEAAAGSVKVGP
jgi:hypothetical protein